MTGGTLAELSKRAARRENRAETVVQKANLHTLIRLSCKSVQNPFAYLVVVYYKV